MTHPTEEAGGGAARAEPDVDLTGVHPLRREQTRLRAIAIRDWLATAPHGAEDEVRAAADLGIGVPGFRALVRAWLEHGRAADLPGARLALERPRRLRPAATRQVEEIVARVIAELGTEARPTDVIAEARRRCATAGVQAPSANTLTARLYRARARQSGTGALTGLIVDHCALRLPVLHDGLVRAPVLTLAFEGDGRVHAFALRMGGPSPQPTAAVLAEALRAPTTARCASPLHLSADFTPGWNEVVDAIAASGVDRHGRIAVPVPSARPVRAVYGDAVAGIGLLPFLTHSATGAGNLARLKAEPLSLAQAREAVADALAASATRSGTDAFRVRLSTDEAESRLAARLEVIAQAPAEAPRVRPKRS